MAVAQSQNVRALTPSPRAVRPSLTSAFSPVVFWLRAGYVSLAFTDELLRRGSASGSVFFTSLKDVVLMVAAVRILFERPYLASVVVPLYPFVAFAAASSVYSSFDGGLLFGLACARSYVVLPLAAAIIGAAVVDVGWREQRVVRLWLVLAGVTCIVALLQEYVRGVLPEVLARRLYMAFHAESQKPYVEGVFASPMTLAVMGLVGFAYAFDRGLGLLLVKGRAWQAWIGGAMVLGYIVYLSRLRTGFVYLVVMGLVLVWRRVFRLGAPALFLLGLLFALVFDVFVAPRLSQAVSSGELDDTYQAKAFLPERIRGVAQFSFSEFELRGYPPTLFGEGAGSSGQLRDLSDAGPSRLVPRSPDSGLFMATVEFGLVGLVLLVFPVFWGVGRLLTVVRRGAAGAVPFVHAFVLVALFMWFLLKSHAAVSTGFTAALIFGHLGAVLAAGTRLRAAGEG
jgi:hypothetical protein